MEWFIFIIRLKSNNKNKPLLVVSLLVLSQKHEQSRCNFCNEGFET